MSEYCKDPLEQICKPSGALYQYDCDQYCNVNPDWDVKTIYHSIGPYNFIAISKPAYFIINVSQTMVTDSMYYDNLMQVAQRTLLEVKKQVPLPIETIGKLRTIIGKIKSHNREAQADLEELDITIPTWSPYSRHGYNIQHYIGTNIAYFKRLGSTIYNRPELQYGICNRLDDETSGATIIALDERTYHTIRSSHMRKLYVCLVNGDITRRKVVDTHINRASMGYFNSINERRRYHTTSPGHGHRIIVHPFSAHTDDDGMKYTLCVVQLFNGLHHQIRVSMASIGHPIVGDNVYCELTDPSLTLLNHNLQFTDRLFLHAVYYTIDFGDHQEEIYCDLPDNLLDTLDSLKYTRAYYGWPTISKAALDDLDIGAAGNEYV